MRIVRLVAALALAGSSALAPSVQAEVVTTLQFFGQIGPDQEFTETGSRIVSDSKSRNDATARATASASADLGTGELKTRAAGEMLIPSEANLAARAVAQAIDTLTINGPGTVPIPVTFEMAVAGDLTVPGTATAALNAFASVQALFTIAGASETATLQRRRDYTAGVATSDTITGLGDWTGEQPVAGTDNHFDLLLSFEAQIVPGTPFDFVAELRSVVGSTGAVGADSISDFGNTGTFVVRLPEDYSITSASGVFLAGPIPEPQTWAMLACGMACVAVLIRRRRRRAIQ